MVAKTPTTKTPIVVFASGRGTNFEAICKAIEAGKLSAKINALVTNVPGCGAVQTAEKYSIPVLPVDSSQRKREEHESEILEKLSGIKHDWVVLAGYMRLFGFQFIQKYSDRGVSRIINIHPSLLPNFKGVNGYAQAVEYGVKYTGCTVHFVDDKCDHGAVIEQTVFPLTGSESVAECETMGIKIENEFYPKILQKIFYEKWKIQELKNQRPRLVFDV